MGTTRLFVRSILAVGLIAVLSGYGLAAEQGDYEMRDEISQSPEISRQEIYVIESQSPVSLQRASKLIGRPLRNTEGKTLGTVKDLVLTSDLDSVSYAVLSTGGFLGIGRALHAVPWSAVQLGVGEALVAPIDEQELKEARGFDATEWPTEGNPRWAGRAGARTEEVTYGVETALDRKEVQNRRASRVMGMMVKEPQGRDAGKISDLVIAMDSGRIAYTIVSYGGFFGLGPRWAAVPTHAITFQPDRHMARLEVGQEVLQANSFNPGSFPNLSDPVYARDIHQAYDVESDWTVLGYVAPEEPATRETAERPATRPAEPPARDTMRAPTPAPGPTPGMTLVEPTESELTGTFDLARVKTIEGTVTDLGKYKCSKTGMDVLWYRVRASDGQITTVNAGPRDYIATQDFYIVRGDRIRLTGSDVASATAGKRVFLPTEIVFGTHTLKVADASGRPLWQERMTRDETDVLGYVPGEERAAPTDFARAGTQAIGAFDLTNMRTIEGTVAEVGKSRAAEGASDIVWLRVTTADGQPINVQVGPRDYISGQNFFIVNGDRVRMTGWETRLETPGATPVFILADITHDGQILQLRNRNGESLWRAQPSMPGRQTDTMGRVPAEEDVGHHEDHAESQPEPDESAQD